jgi:chromosomal replication initiator protein
MKYKKELEEVLCLINGAQDILSKLLPVVDVEGKALDFDVTDFKLASPKNFHNFIEGYGNKTARKTGLSIADYPGKNTSNPYFVYGPSGCGKSHLINAIGLEFQETNPNKRVYYITAQQFQRQFTESVRKNTTNDFINFYHSSDMLIVDDIQEWQTTSKTLEVFYNIFNHLLRNGKQVILASDRPPVELQNMEKRILSRFSSGIVVEMESLDMQLCIDFLNAKCKNDGLMIPVDIIEFIAKTANSNICNLEGIVNSLKAYSVVNNSNIDINVAKRIVRSFIKMD